MRIRSARTSAASAQDPGGSARLGPPSWQTAPTRPVVSGLTRADATVWERLVDAGRRLEETPVNKTPDPGEVVRDKVIPAAEEIVAALAERVGPYVKEAADKVAPLTHQAVEAVTPYAQQVSDAVAPYAQQAADRVGPLAQQAADRVAPLTHQAAEAVAPYAALVREQGLKTSPRPGRPARAGAGRGRGGGEGRVRRGQGQGHG